MCIRDRYRLWTKGKPAVEAPLVYKGEKKADAFLRFCQKEAGIWVGLPGQLKEFDTLAKAFAGDKPGTIAKAEALLKGAADKDAEYAKYYVKVMTKMNEKAEFAGKEKERLQKMIDDGSVKPAKKEQFGRRLNILSSFS